MRAIVYSETGPSSVLRLVERELPEPGPGEVRVRLARAGVNPTDWKQRAGGTYGPLGPDAITPGQDGAGTVDALGEGVAGIAVGDRVWLYLVQHEQPHGTAAEYAVVPLRKAVPLPDNASFDVGAALGVPALTAHRALTSGELTDRIAPGTMAGQTVLVHGGAGAVGNAAIQLARWAGATVIATVSSEEKAALAIEAGAHQTVNYRVGDAVTAVQDLAPQGVDLVVDVAPAQNNDLDREVIRNRGTIAIYANNGGDELVMPVRATFSKNIRYQFVLLYTVGDDLLARAAEDVTAAVAAGAFGVGEEYGVPLTHFALEDTAAAHDAVEAGAIGKVLLDLA
ncbi:NADPH:quinone reductase [Nocardioides sp.]|jgi:NADPH2:quinone reductase|uniref:NADPH:quinone reductase n=1 Tax=Nocardioides sp. TaxID=35761 RepID=UPI002C2612B5|nr:NADPH:quinone reductase [Nocardioides sp.]HVX54700.1 NADPH:quinone reductase [Nocardioides sp.]